jgi:hypothetical protein
MLPLQQAYEVKQSIIEYLKATFDFKEKAVSKSFLLFYFLFVWQICLMDITNLLDSLDLLDL